MCGIAGLSYSDKDRLSKVLASIRHRGPDGNSIYSDQDVTLGHALLSIRADTPKVAIQPFHEEGEDWVLVFNGEIYNTREVCAEFNIPFNELDTKVLYDLIKLKGVEFPRYVHGMYSICLYSKTRKEFHLFRDPTGQKPLYYVYDGRNLSFCSELTPLLEICEKRELDYTAIEISTSLGYVPAPATIFKEIKKLRPSEKISFNLKTRKLSSEVLTEFYRYSTEGYTDYEYLSTCIRDHLQTSQPLGINLSGGLDSSVLLYEARELGKKITTYTTKFESSEESFNEEAVLATKLSRDFNANHSEVLITYENFKKNLISSYQCVEEPNYNIGMPHYHILAQKQGWNGDGIRVLLAGDGGDELFGGYTYYHSANERINRHRHRMPGFLYDLARGVRDKEYKNLDNPVHRWLYVRKFSNRYSAKVNLFKELNYLNELNAIYPSKSSDIFKLMLLDRNCWQANENFIRTDKIFMSQAIEIRSPLAYFPLRRYFDEKLIDSDYIDSRSNKIWMRKCYDGRLPEYITNRSRKWGWQPPFNDWFQKGLKQEILELLLSAKNNSPVVDWDKVINTIEKSEAWPGRELLIYISLASLSLKYDVKI